MWNLPDLRPLVFLAVIGFVAVAAGAVWLAYHVVMALAMYVGPA